jgi:hypothetical protein
MQGTEAFQECIVRGAIVAALDEQRHLFIGPANLRDEQSGHPADRRRTIGPTQIGPT